MSADDTIGAMIDPRHLSLNSPVVPTNPKLPAAPPSQASTSEFAFDGPAQEDSPSATEATKKKRRRCSTSMSKPALAKRAGTQTPPVMEGPAANFNGSVLVRNGHQAFVPVCDRVGLLVGAAAFTALESATAQSFVVTPPLECGVLPDSADSGR